MTRQLYIPTESAYTEMSIKKSRFISTVWPIQSRDQAKATILAQRVKHPKANHVAWSYCLDTYSRQDIGMSDDGEPSGTAGRPTLNVLQHSMLTNALVTTVRYFGGIKLGTGGLVKAYTESAKLALEEVSRIPLIERQTLQLQFPYEQLKTIKKILDRPNIQMVDTQYAAAIALTCRIPKESLADIEKQLIDCTKGTIAISHSDSSITPT